MGLINFMLLTVFFATVVVYLKTVWDHANSMKAFYSEIDCMLDNYYVVYPNADFMYFHDLVLPEKITMWQPWVKDYNNFITNPYKLRELYDGDKKYNVFTETSIVCPWCKNDDLHKFIYAPLDEEIQDYGVLVCLKCKSSTPPGKLKDGVFTIKNDFDEV